MSKNLYVALQIFRHPFHCKKNAVAAEYFKSRLLVKVCSIEIPSCSAGIWHNTQSGLGQTPRKCLLSGVVRYSLLGTSIMAVFQEGCHQPLLSTTSPGCFCQCSPGGQWWWQSKHCSYRCRLLCSWGQKTAACSSSLCLLGIGQKQVATGTHNLPECAGSCSLLVEQTTGAVTV